MSHFFCGKAGAGKTTLALGLARDQQAILISEDIWLNGLSNHYSIGR
ncbi:AAA domain-containing protein [Limnobacter thiooxidans]|nr:AAA domain-containing protein [Limnobacter thiooxidans]